MTRSLARVVAVLLALTLASASCVARAQDDEARHARRDVPTIATGGSVWVAAYLAAIVVPVGLWADAGSDPRDLHRDLLGAGTIPLVGPWVQLGVDVDDGRRALWAVLGVLELGGLVLLGVGHFVGHPDDEGVAWLGLRPGGLELRGRF